MADLVGAPPVTPERLEARYRAVERSIADSNGLDAQERWIDTPLPPGRVRILCTGRRLTELEVGAISWNSTDRVSSIAEDLDLVLLIGAVTAMDAGGGGQAEGRGAHRPGL